MNDDSYGLSDTQTLFTHIAVNRTFEYWGKEDVL